MFPYSITAVSFSILSWYYVKKNYPFGRVWKSMILISVFVLFEENQNLFVIAT